MKLNQTQPELRKAESMDNGILSNFKSLEVAQAVVDNAPKGASHVTIYQKWPFKIYVKNTGAKWEFWYSRNWYEFGLRIDMPDERTIALSDLRAAITQAEIIVGSWVVPIGNHINSYNAVREVVEVDGSYIKVRLPDMIRSYRGPGVDWRIATAAEEKAGHRIDEPSLLGGKPEAYRRVVEAIKNNQICIEEETPELFQSKHCSPRLLEHMKFDVSVVPASKPECDECAIKDHDLTVLRKLQASNLSIYAGRIHSQQTHILMREVIIVVLIGACIALFLWGLK